MRFFDTHCHLAGLELLPTASELCQRALQANVSGLALIAADEQSLEAAPILTAKLTQEFPDLKIVYTSGVHPHDAEKISDVLWEKIKNSAQSGAVAIGETGLDFYYDHSDRKIQIEAFERHIQIALELKKPLVIHCRQARDEVLAALAPLKGVVNPGILHCFTEDESTAKTLVDWGFMISFSGIVSFKNAKTIQEVAKWIPVDQILIETDSPWLAPIPHRGKRNEPAFVPHVFEFIKTLRNENADDFARNLWENSCRVYNLGSD